MDTQDTARRFERQKCKVRLENWRKMKEESETVGLANIWHSQQEREIRGLKVMTRERQVQ